MDTDFYTDAQKSLQDEFGTRRLADSHLATIVHDTLTDDDRAFIQSRDMLFLSTVDQTGHPTVSYKGGAPGFVTVDHDGTILMPCYDGNGMFLSMGNVATDAKVGLLFIDFETPHRLRVQGTARLERSTGPGTQARIRIEPSSIFVNCARYIHTFKKVAASRYLPDADGRSPLAEWKRIDIVHDSLPDHDRTAVDAVGTISFEQYFEKVSRGQS